MTQPIRLTIRPLDEGGAGHKSISHIVWDNIPGLAVLTGRNGSGKTHLLEALAFHFTQTVPHGAPGDRLPVVIESGDFSLDPDQVGFVPSTGRFSGGGGASIGQMAGFRSNFLNEVINIHSYKYDPVQMARVRHMNKLLGGRDPRSLTLEEVNTIFSDDFFSLFVDLDVAGNIATIFVAHRLKILEALERGTPGLDKDGNELGDPPWSVVDDALRVAGFPYEIVSPQDKPILEHYTLELRDKFSGALIRPENLSSGEQVILQLMLWLFGASKGNAFPKLLLLDEPDAHLHPSMTVQFLDVIAEVLVKKYGVRVIMTTHSPSTVALAPEGSVFQMERGAKMVQPVLDRAVAIANLTSGLITVSAATKFCFVEDEGDVAFYEAVRDILTDYGPSQDPKALAASPSLAFIAASIGKRTQKISGGCSVVGKWVEKLDAEPLTRTFLGVVDRDTGNTPTGRVKVLGRYSFENYLLDPLNVFGLLLENGTEPMISSLKVSSGDEHRLRSQPSDVLQAISDVITQRVETVQPALCGSPRVTVAYTTGQSIEVPDWIIEHRGHDLLPLVQQAWGSPSVVNPVRLTKALRRVRLIPLDLAAVFADLQQV